VSPRRRTVGRSPICCAGDRETAKEAEYVGMGGRQARAVRRTSYKASQESAVPSPESFGLKLVDALHAYDLNWSFQRLWMSADWALLAWQDGETNPIFMPAATPRWIFWSYGVMYCRLQNGGSTQG
jgi:hypothetical protein